MNKRLVYCEEAVAEGIQCERGWRCPRVVGRLDFLLVIVPVLLLDQVDDAGVSVFVVSTFDCGLPVGEASGLPTSGGREEG